MKIIKYLKSLAYGMFKRPHLTWKLMINHAHSWHFSSRLSLRNKRIISSAINATGVNTVVDFGCGVMDLNELLAPEIKYIGVDSDPGLIKTFHRFPSFLPVPNIKSTEYLETIGNYHTEIALVAFNVLHSVNDADITKLLSLFMRCENYKILICDEINDTSSERYMVSHGRIKNFVNGLQCECEIVPCDDTRCLLVLTKK